MVLVYIDRRWTMTVSDRIYCILAEGTAQYKQLTDLVGQPSSLVPTIHYTGENMRLTREQVQLAKTLASINGTSINKMKKLVQRRAKRTSVGTRYGSIQRAEPYMIVYS